jgi:hypothetical protein
MAALYVLYYNLIAPHLPDGRKYVAQVNGLLSSPEASCAGMPVRAAGHV